MMSYDESENVRENFGKFIYQLLLNSKHLPGNLKGS